jgi:preprotein translocase SecE subunit
MANPITATRDYLQHSIVELKKVSWPTKEMTLRYSVLVVAVSVAMALFFAALDFGLQKGVTAALSGKSIDTSAPIEAAPVTPTLDTTGVDGNGTNIQVTPAPAETSAPNENAPITLPPIEIPAN